MSGARKVAFGAVVIGGLVILGPRIPGMLAKFAKGTGQLTKVVVNIGSDAYTAGQKAGKNTVMKGIAQPVN